MLAPLVLQAGDDHSPVNPGGSLSLREALRLTLLQNPELAAARSSIRAAEGRQLQAGVLPNPSLFSEVDNLVGSGPYGGARQSESTLQLSQVVELGGKRAARLRVANSGRELASFDYESKRLEVLVATTKAFVQTLAAQRRETLARETASLTNDLVPAIERRVEAGAANAVEVTRAQNAVAAARIDAQQSARDLAIARQRLAASWGAPAARFDNVAGDLGRTPVIPAYETLAQRVDQNPAIGRFPAEITQRKAEIAKVRSEAVPDVTVALGPRYLAETQDAAIRLNVSIPLAIFDRKQGAIREARAELERTGHLQQAAASQIAVLLVEAYRTATAAKQEMDILRDTLLPGSEQAFRQIDEGYAAGRYGLLDLLDARRTLTAARTQLLNAQTAYHQALAEIDGLTGQVRQAPRATTVPARKTVSTSRKK